MKKPQLGIPVLKTILTIKNNINKICLQLCSRHNILKKNSSPDNLKISSKAVYYSLSITDFLNIL